jgi:hypothetical protein
MATGCTRKGKQTNNVAVDEEFIRCEQNIWLVIMVYKRWSNGPPLYLIHN